MPAVYLFFPETNGLSVEEVDDTFRWSKSIWDPARVAQDLPAVHIAEVDVPVPFDLLGFKLQRGPLSP